MHILDASHHRDIEYQGPLGLLRGTSIWWFRWIFFFMAYLFALFAVIGDLFRDHS